MGQQCGEEGLLVGSPSPGLIFMSQDSKRCDNVREAQDKLLIEIAKA